jgi:hypothetical protein
MVEIMRLKASGGGRRGGAARLVVASDCLRVPDEDAAEDGAAPLRARVAELEAALEARRADRSKLVGLLTQFLAARERELAVWRRQLRDERTEAGRKMLELEAALEHERAERARERIEHEAFVDDLRAKHAAEWSKLDDERGALAARLERPHGPPPASRLAGAVRALRGWRGALAAGALIGTAPQSPGPDAG